MIHSGNWFKSNIYLVVHNNFVLASDSYYCKWDGGTTLTVMISIFKLTEDHQSGFTECQTYFLSFLLHHLSQPLTHGEKKIDFDFSHFTLVTSIFMDFQYLFVMSCGSWKRENSYLFWDICIFDQYRITMKNKGDHTSTILNSCSSQRYRLLLPVPVSYHKGKIFQIPKM